MDLEEECRRVLPVIAALARRSRARLSVDTRKAEVMRRAALEGAHIINDVSALTHDPRSLEAAAGLGLPVVLMHAQGDPRTMQDKPTYDDVVLDVYDALEARVAACERAGIPRARLIVDPGIGFGKNLAHNLALLGSLERLPRAGLRRDAGRLAQELHRPPHRGRSRTIACRARLPRLCSAPRRACSSCACTTWPRRARRWPCGKGRSISRRRSGRCHFLSPSFTGRGW